MLLLQKKKKNRITISFYKYFLVEDTSILRKVLLNFFQKLKVLGRVYISTEGINAQINILKNDLAKIKYFIKKLHNQLNNVFINISLDNTRIAFIKLKVKIRKKIVSDGIDNFCFKSSMVGKYLNVFEVNKMINDKNSIFLDIRNSYEYAIGRFINAINISANTFRDQLNRLIPFLNNFKHKNVVLYCTGGIRCEKATAWIKYHNFQNVYHIKGGIIHYVNESKKYNLPILFKGKNFVFDSRMYEKVTNDILGTCFHCKVQYDKYRNCKNSICNVLLIQCKSCSSIFKGFCSLKCISKNIS